PHEGDGRAFAVGPGHVNDRREVTLRMAELLEQAQHALERQVDLLRMQRQQPRHDSVERGHRRLLRTFARAHALAGMGRAGTLRRSTAGALVSTRQSRARVARNWWRWTTMSTMPWSRRYSAR